MNKQEWSSRLGTHHLDFSIHNRSWNSRGILTWTVLTLMILLCGFMYSSHAHGEGHALYFDGINDHCEIPRDSSLNMSSQITMESWIKWGGDAGQAAFQIILNQDFIVYEICVGEEYGNGHFLWFMDKVNTSAPEVFSGWREGGAIELDEWNHVAISYDGSRARAYINGVLTGDYAASGNMPVRNNPVHIGARGVNTPGSFFNGEIDEVRLWNVARTGDEIREHMNRGLSGDEYGLVGYWNFNEGEGQVASDKSSHENDARLGLSNLEDAGDPTWVESTLLISEPHGENQPPSAPIVAIHPPTPTTVNDLVCTATGSVDPEGGPVFYSFSWFRDGVQLENESSFSLSHEQTARGQLIECVVTPSDGAVEGEPGRASVVIENSLPTAPVIRILPENPTPGDGLAVWIVQESFDADGDQIVYTFDWYESNDGVTWTRRPELSSNLPFSLGQPSISHLYTQVAEYWRVEVTPVEAHTISRTKGTSNDTIVSGEKGTDEVLIQPDLAVSAGGALSMVDAADLLVIRSVWHQTKESLESKSTLTEMFFEPGAPDDARVEGRDLIFLIVRNWYGSSSR